MNESELYVKKFLALLGVISVLALTGCGRIDSAATIGSVSISQADAQAVVDEVLAERTKVDTEGLQLTTGEELNRGQLRFTIITQLFVEIAKELKIEITPTQIDQRKAELIAQVGGESELPRNLVAANIAPSNFEKYVKAVMTSDLIAEALRQSIASPAATGAGARLSDFWRRATAKTGSHRSDPARGQVTRLFGTAEF